MDTTFLFSSTYDRFSVKYKPNDIIFFEGDLGNDIFIIRSGSVKAVKFRNGNMCNITKFSAGSIFGEYALYSKNHRTATIIANSDVELLKMNHKNFENLILSNPNFASNFLILLSERTQNTLEILDIVNQHTVERKVLKCLLYYVSSKQKDINIRDLPELIGEPFSKITEIYAVIDTFKKRLLVFTDEIDTIVGLNEGLIKRLYFSKEKV